MASKILTREQAQSRKDAAVRFAENVLDDPDKADDIESEDLDDWIDRKGIALVDNPRERNLRMANGGNGGNGQTKQDLMDQIDELQQENQDLQDQLDAIQDIISGPDEGDDDDDDADDDDAA